MLRLVYSRQDLGIRFESLRRIVQPPGGLNSADWRQHPNGHGWVKRGAFVAETAFLGPECVVSGRAWVLDYAKVIDRASITGEATIAGDATIGGRVLISGLAKIWGDATVMGDVEIGGYFVMTKGKLVSGRHCPFSQSALRGWRRASLLLRHASEFEPDGKDTH